MAAPLIGVIVGFLTGAAAPLAGVGIALPPDMVAAAVDADHVIAAAAKYAPIACRLTDAPLDRLADRAKGKRSFLARIEISLATAADSVCTADLSSPIARLKATAAAAEAVKRANVALDGASPSAATASAPIAYLRACGRCS